MLGLGLPELIVICVIALLVLGPQKLPDAGKAIGQAIRGLKSSMEGVDDERADSRALAAGICAGCGKNLEPRAAFCPACGRAVKDKAA